MQQRMCLQGHTWWAGEQNCPTYGCGERGAPAQGDGREPDHERRARERLEADPDLPYRTPED